MISCLGVFCYRLSKGSPARFSNASSKVTTLFALALILSNFASAQVSEKVLHTFTGGSDGAYPGIGLTMDAAGHLYGTTSGGGGTGIGCGVSGCGTVFELSEVAGVWTKTTIHSFSSSDGASPEAALSIDALGNLYGTTLSGGSSGVGTVFELAPASGGAWNLTTVHTFVGGSNDGSIPEAGVILDPAGNLYGTTLDGGTGGGTAFELTLKAGVWTETILHSFTGTAGDGFAPTAGLVRDAAGNLYGGTDYGGSCNSIPIGCGIVFELTANSAGGWNESILHTFSGGSDGVEVVSGLTLDETGNIYGVTAGNNGNNNNGYGTVFELRGFGSARTYSILYSFTGGADGGSPNGLALGADGNLYGTTSGGGTHGVGTVFKLANSSGVWSESVLFNFAGGSSGDYPRSTPILDSSGNLYGTTSGDSSSYGIAFEITDAAPASPWQPLKTQPSFNASTALLLTDGTVMVQDYCASDWWKLIPDNTGNYVNGTWKPLASTVFPPPYAVYAPLFYASAVLADGRVIVEGGEYNNSTGTSCSSVHTAQGAIFDPTLGVKGTWSIVSPPTGWTRIGDAPSAVLSDETFMMGACCSTQQALLNATNLAWTATGTGKADSNNEEGWTLLPGFGSLLLTVDVDNPVPMKYEQYLSRLGKWITPEGTTEVELVDTTNHEVGPAVLRPDGTVFATGATGYNAVYNTATSTWTAGPKFSSNAGLQLAIPDGPIALLPDGNVLCDTSPVIETINDMQYYPPGSDFFEFNGTTLTAVAGPPNAPNDPAYVGRMLLLPTGQVLFTDGTKDVEIYSPSGTYESAWAPTIKSWPTTITHGQANYVITGTQFNGLSQAVAYGDDAQAATNYPLVRITNNHTKHVFYARTHGHSTMGVATGSTVVSTNFDAPSNLETGASTLVVVANGIPSNSVAVTVQ